MERTSILLVEDEPKMSAYVKMGLEENNYHIDVAMDGRTGADLALRNNYSAIVLDVNLPELNGYEVCRLIRQKKPRLPILMLSALNKIENKLEGFNTGTDDYLVKPFEFAELLARLKVLLTRTEQIVEKNKVLKVADLIMDLDSKMVKRGKNTVELTLKEFNLLQYLMQNKNKVVSRSELLEKIWGINFDTGTNVIDVYINFLRKKIDLPTHPKLIHTYIGMGYILKVAGDAD
ncbi:MAG TPA: response regulator transcription factor [Bacteroidia bacterium]|jgi:two-component system copper resistance phosphate regulon response regulator CusR|nr:response regulator transcription factor [Bacteroidia bacterium]